MNSGRDRYVVSNRERDHVMKIRICHLYPDALNLYGDRGNVLCMRRRLEWRGISCEVDSLEIGEHKDLSVYDLFFMGGGQDFEQEVLLEDLHSGNGREIKAAIEDGKTFLCICGGYQILGNYYETQDGHRCEFLGAIDFYTVGGARRLIGNYAFELPGEAEEGRYKNVRETSGKEIVVGFENHSGRTWLGERVKPLGKVLAGYGNNGKDRTEGVHDRNVFGTYSHGPVLPKNPVLCDRILLTALKRKYGSSDFPVLEDRFEKQAHQHMMDVLHLSHHSHWDRA